jgi:glutamate dehydrogenase/leucine dehydrogenase
MDVVQQLDQITHAVVAKLTPMLPALLKVGEGALAKVGENVTDAASKLWKKLLPRLSERTGGREAAQAVAESPNDVELQEALKIHVKKLLAADSAFAQELAALLPAATGDSVQNSPITASGAGSVAVGISNAPIKPEFHQHQDTHHHYHGDSEKND